MRTRLIKRVVAVAAGLLLSLSGLAFAGAFEGSDDPGNDETTAIVSPQTDDHQGEDGDDQGEDENADDQGENSDDQGENNDDQGEDADDQGDNDNTNDDDDQGGGGDSQD